MPSSDCGTISMPSGPSIWRNSRSLPGLLLARTRRRMSDGEAVGGGARAVPRSSRLSVEGGALRRHELADAFLSQIEERVQLRAREGCAFRGALHLHQSAAARHDDVHVGLAGGVLLVVE